MPSRRPARRWWPAAGFASGVSWRETGCPRGELAGRSELSSCRKSSELRDWTSEVERAGQEIKYLSSFYAVQPEKSRSEVCQRAEEVSRSVVVNKEKMLMEEEPLYSTVRRVKGEGEGFRPYQPPRQPWGYQVNNKIWTFLFDVVFICMNLTMN